MLIKYIKSVLWRVAKCLSYIEDARCLKVNHLTALYCTVLQSGTQLNIRTNPSQAALFSVFSIVLSDSISLETDRQTRATHSLRHMQDKNPRTERNKKSRTSLRPPGQAHAAATHVAPRAAVALPSEVSIWDGRPSLAHLSAENWGKWQQMDYCRRIVAGFDDVI